MGGKHESQCLVEGFGVVSSSSTRTDFLNALYIFYRSLRLCVLLLEAVQAESCVRLGPWLGAGWGCGPGSARCRAPGGLRGRSPAALRGAEGERGCGRLLSAVLSGSRGSVMSRKLFPRVYEPCRLVLTSQKNDRRTKWDWKHHWYFSGSSVG